MIDETQDLKEAMLEAKAEAALDGHDLGSFEPAETIIGGYQAECRLCHSTIWVGDTGLKYSLLEKQCPNRS